MHFLPARPPEGLSAIGRFKMILAGLGVIILLLVLLLVISSRARVLAIRTGLEMAGADMAQDEQGQTNLLLLGVGDATHDAADLTDAMILASIDPVRTRSIVLLSLPRDLYIDKAGDMRIQGRINTIYFYEKQLLERQGLEEGEASLQALTAVGQAIGEKLGVPVHGVLKADFTAVESVVDAFGGVDVVVPETIADYTYPVKEGKKGLFKIEAGPQHLDGPTALMYARSRHSTSDFDRSARQQQLIKALGEKVRGLGRFGQMTLLPGLYRNLSAHVETTMRLEELLGLINIAMELSLDRVITMQINYNLGNDLMEAVPGGFVTDAPLEEFGGASVLLPFSLSGSIHDWNQIRTFVRLLLERRDVYLEGPRIAIRSVTAKHPHPWRLRNEMLRYGLEALKIEKTDSEQHAFSGSFVAYGESRFRPSAELIGVLLGLPVAKTAGTSQTGSGDLLILVGSDYRFVPFQTRSGGVLSVGGAQ